MAELDDLVAALAGQRRTPYDDPIAGWQVPTAAPAATHTPGPPAVDPFAAFDMSAQAAPLTPKIYSAARKAVGEAKQEKAPLDQWLSTMRNQGVKEEELNWLGFGKEPMVAVPQFPGKTISKQDLLDYLDKTGVKVKETVRGGPKETLADYDPQAIEAARKQLTEWSGFEPHEHSEEDILGHLRDISEKPTGRDPWLSPKYNDYQLEGAPDTYRELLLQRDTSGHPVAQRLDAIQKRLDEINSHEHVTPELDQEYANLVGERGTLKSQLPKAYQSGHWEEPDILTHVRTNERVLPGTPANPDPRRTLHIEEIQSDWHQTGRKEGYAPQNLAELKKAFFDADSASDAAYYKWRENETPENKSAYEQSKLALDEARRAYEDARSQGRTPQGPFKQTWPDLALKRIINEAAEKGYDAVSWTPGQKNVDRYPGLEKNLTNLHYRFDPKEGYSVSGSTSGGRNHDFNNGDWIPDKELEKHVGKELADKIRLNNAERGNGSLRDINLKVGGEGMRQFYDKMLVDKANAIGKKYGAKVEKSPMVAPLEVPPLPANWSVKYDPGNPAAGLKRSWDIIDEHGNVVEHSNRSEEHALARAFNMEPEWRKHNLPEERGHQSHIGVDAWVLPITPELRRAATGQGFTLFAGGVPTTAPGSREEENQRILETLKQPGTRGPVQ